MADLDRPEKAPTPDLRNEHHETTLLLNDIYLAQAKGYLVTLKAQHIKENDKCSKYFLAIEKRNYNFTSSSGLGSNTLF